MRHLTVAEKAKRQVVKAKRQRDDFKIYLRSMSQKQKMKRKNREKNKDCKMKAKLRKSKTVVGRISVGGRWDSSWTDSWMADRSDRVYR